jgi:hypothetical protein
MKDANPGRDKTRLEIAAAADHIGKVFVALGYDLRQCLICDECGRCTPCSGFRPDLHPFGAVWPESTSSSSAICP